MNDSQKEAIERLAKAIQDIVPHLYPIIGEESATELGTAAAELRSVMKE